jgi:hypothetical protein
MSIPKEVRMSDFVRLDTQSEVDRLLAQYGKRITCITREQRWLYAAARVLTVLLLFIPGGLSIIAGWKLMSLSDAIVAARGGSPTDVALAFAKVANATTNLPDFIAARAAWLAAVRASIVANRLPAFLAPPETSLRLLEERVIHVGWPVALVVGVILLIAAFKTALSAWAYEQAASLLKEFAQTITRSSKSPDAAAPGGAFALGGLARAAAVVTGTAVITFGVCRIAVPDSKIDLAVPNTSATAQMHLGKFDFNVEGKTFTIPADRITLEDYGSPDVSLGRDRPVRFELPDMRLYPDARATRDLIARVDHLEHSLHDRQTRVEEHLVQHTENLDDRNLKLTSELTDRPTRHDLETVKTDLTKQIDDTHKAVKCAVAGLTTVIDTQRAAPNVAALQLVKEINSENDRVFNSLFRQNVVTHNCEIYNALEYWFPNLVAPGGCIQRGRLASVDPYAQHVGNYLLDKEKFEPAPASLKQKTPEGKDAPKGCAE